MMNNWDIQITVEEGLYVAEIVNRDREPYYAQGSSYEESLSNLFDVIKTIRDIDKDRAQSNAPLNFSIPAMA